VTAVVVVVVTEIKEAIVTRQVVQVPVVVDVVENANCLK
jgi:hypothetical protein